MLKNTTKADDMVIGLCRECIKDAKASSSGIVCISAEALLSLICCIENLDNKIETMESKLYNANKKLNKSI